MTVAGPHVATAITALDLGAPARLPAAHGGAMVRMNDPSRARAHFDDLAAEHLHRPGVGRWSMFGRDTLSVAGTMYAFFHDDRLALKLPDDSAAALLATGEAITPEMGGRAMRRWVAVPLGDDVERWRQLLDAAHIHAGGPVEPAGPSERFAALVEEFARCPDVAGPSTSSRRGFGSSALRVRGSIFAMLSADHLVVKLPADRVAAVIADGRGRPFDARKGRPMKEWLSLSIDDHDTWSTLAHEARDFVGAGRPPRTHRCGATVERQWSTPERW